MKKLIKTSALVIIVILLNASLASALTLGSVTGFWSNPIGGGTSVEFLTVGDEVQGLWGVPTEVEKSGLGFTGNSALPVDFSPGSEFEIGMLRHFNQPVFAPAVSAVDLTIDLSFSNPVLNPSFTFTLEVDETPNAEPCVYPSATPCADKISFPSAFPTLSESYWLGGKFYTLQIVGFRSSPGGVLLTEFISDERQTNTAYLYGALTSPPALEVPVDLKPGSCPNPINTKDKGVLTVAVMGTDTFDPTQIDPATVQFAGASPLRWSIEDAGIPYYPFTGKEDALDCLENMPDEFGVFDGYLDYVFKFSAPEVISLLGDVSDRDVLVINLVGYLKEEFGGGLFIGEDVTIIIAK